jgi:hypothetical protein
MFSRDIFIPFEMQLMTFWVRAVVVVVMDLVLLNVE